MSHLCQCIFCENLFESESPARVCESCLDAAQNMLHTVAYDMDATPDQIQSDLLCLESMAKLMARTERAWHPRDIFDRVERTVRRYIRF